MQSKIKKLVKKLLLWPFVFIDFLGRIYSYFLKLLSIGLSDLWDDILLKRIQLKTLPFSHKCKNGSSFEGNLFVPNEVCRFRVKTFSTKEPETLLWIDEYGGNGALFDIGANVGLYSIYYAATKQSNVYAFEPSVFNLALLAKNIDINKVSHLVNIISNPLSNQNQIGQFSLSSVDEGGALSAFGVNYGFDGRPLQRLIGYNTLGLTIDKIIELGFVKEVPKLIKLDVDGIEHLILGGAKETLLDSRCQSVLIEVTDSFAEQSSTAKQILHNSGFRLKEKTHSEMFNESTFAAGFNQIWVKH